LQAFLTHSYLGVLRDFSVEKKMKNCVFGLKRIKGFFLLVNAQQSSRTSRISNPKNYSLARIIQGVVSTKLFKNFLQ